MGGSAAYYIVSAIVAGASYTQSERAEDKAHEEKQRSRAEQRRIQGEQSAQNAAKAASERRRQLREERVRRAKLVQSGINTGVSESSGVMGGEGNLATQRGAAVGENLGMLQAAENISIFSQNAANWDASAASSMAKSNQWGQVGSMFSSMAMQGFANSGSKTPAGTTPQPDITSGGQYSDAPRGIYGG